MLLHDKSGRCKYGQEMCYLRQGTSNRKQRKPFPFKNEKDLDAKPPESKSSRRRETEKNTGMHPVHPYRKGSESAVIKDLV